MKTKIKVEKEVELTTLMVNAGARYWEDSEINGQIDEQGLLVPCRVGEKWTPVIDIETGIITNWEKGKTARIHYKVCDDGVYHLLDKEGNAILTKDGYVPNILDLYNDSYGDYIILNIDENGQIADWDNNPNIGDFFEED